MTEIVCRVCGADGNLDGLLFKTDMHLTISNVTSVTVFVTPITADTDNG